MNKTDAILTASQPKSASVPTAAQSQLLFDAITDWLMSLDENERIELLCVAVPEIAEPVGDVLFSSMVTG